MAHRVLQQVVEDAPDHLGIDHGSVHPAVRRQGHALGGGGIGMPRDQRVEKGLERDGHRSWRAPLGHRQQLGDEPVEAHDLVEDVGQRAARPFDIGGGERVLGAQAHGGERIADLMRDAAGDASERGETFGGGDPFGEVFGAAPLFSQAPPGLVQRVDDPVELTRAGARQGGHLPPDLGQSGFDAADTA